MGIDADLVTVEARFERVDRHRTELILSGLPDPIIRESRGRLLSALQANGLRVPQGRLFLNLVPAGLRKGGETLDLPLALAAIAAVGHIRGQRLTGTLFLGELGIDGALHAVPGGLAAGLTARQAGLSTMIAPKENAREAGVLEGLQALAATGLSDVVKWLATGTGLDAQRTDPDDGEDAPRDCGATTIDLDQVRGQGLAKHALAVAAAGGHDVLFSGPPGTGKSLLARALTPLLPPLDLDERVAVTRVRSLHERSGPGLVRSRPFRAPHHTTSTAGLIGGGSPPRPGEVTLAHKGVLFLDELPEFRRETLEALRQPLESERVLLSRAGRRLEFPASFHLVSAMNPCPCGYQGHPTRACRCSPFEIHRYRRRLSGPFLDRIDLRLELSSPTMSELESEAPPALRSSALSRSVLEARERTHARQGSTANARLSADQLDRFVRLDAGSRQLLERAASRHGLSARGIQSVRRVARTLADLEGIKQPRSTHLAEALALRRAVE